MRSIFLQPKNLTGLLTAGFDIFFEQSNYHGPKKYYGTAVEICEQIVSDRWTGNFFSAGENPRLNQFWTRDTAWCLKGLLDLGHKDKIHKTYSWALEKFESGGRITTTIDKNGRAWDVPAYGSDSLPMLLYALKTGKFFELVEKHKDFLNYEIKSYFRELLDPRTHLIRNDILTCTAKDTMRRKQICADNSFLVFTQKLLNYFPNLENPVRNLNLTAPFLKNFWTGTHFINDTDPKDNFRFISADANVWPYWTKIVTDPKMVKSSLDIITKEHLDEPFPVKFQNFYNPNDEFVLSRLFLPNYNSGDSIMTLLGPIYIELEQEVYLERAKIHLKQYLDLIEKYHTYVEVFTPNGLKPLVGRGGLNSETGMLWAAMIPSLVKKIL